MSSQIRRASHFVPTAPALRALLRAALVGAALAALSACGGGGGGGGGETPPEATVTAGSTVALTAPIDPGETCANGGYSIDYGIDANGNGTLDEDEVAGTAVICNGTDGGLGDVLVKLTDTGASASCPFGGTRVDMGLDDGAGGGTASDGILQAGEVRQTNWLCYRGAGVSEGTTSQPVPLTVDRLHHAKVAAGGTSYYRITSPMTWQYLVSLTQTDSDLRWRLYSSSSFASAALLATCDVTAGIAADETCLSPSLTKNSNYYVAVNEQSNIPNLFDLLVAPDTRGIAANVAGSLFDVNLDDGAVNYLSSTGLPNLDSMVFLPATTKLYASSGEAAATCPGCLHIVNPSTGAKQPVNLTYNNEPTTAAFFGLSASPVDGKLYAMWRPVETGVYSTVNPTTGVITDVFDTIAAPADSLSFDGSGNLYATDADSLHLIDPAGQTDTLLGTLSIVTPPAPPGNAKAQGLVRAERTISRIAFDSLTVRPSDGLLLGATGTGDLYAIDTCALETWPLNDTPAVNQLEDALAVVGMVKPRPPPPCLAAAAGDGKVNLTWRAYPRASAFALYWGTAPGIDPGNAATYTGRLAGVSSPYTHTGRSNDRTYYYVLAAVVDGREVYSAEQAAVPETQIVYDFETGTQNWMREGSWGLDTTTPHGGSQAIGDSPDLATYSGGDAATSMASPTLNLSGYRSATLTFWHKLDLIAGDTAVVQYSNDGGSNWANAAGGSFTSNVSTYAEVTLELDNGTTGLTSQTKVRFLLSPAALGQGTADGWTIDDVTITPHR